MEDYIPGTKIKIFWFTEEELYGCLPEGFVFHGEKPLYHQLLSIVFSLQFEDGVGLFHDMGTGKSYTAINIARAKGIQDKILVISVNASLENWKNEFKLYAGGEYKVQVVSGSRDDKEELLGQDADVYIINYEGTFIRKRLERDVFGRKKRREFQFDEMILNGLDRDWNYLILDESRSVMNIQAYQTRIAMRLAFQSKFRVILSGLPIVKTLEEIFSQQFCVDLGREFSSSFGKFKKTYFQKLFLCPKCKEIQAKCTCKLMGRIAYPIWVAKPESEELVHEKMYQQGIRFSKRECLDLPDKVYVTRTLEMKGDAKAFYQKLKAQKSATVITKHNKVELTAMLMRFMQICGGWLKAEDEVKEFKDNTKLQELMYLLDGDLAEEKVAIVSCFVAEQEGIYNHLIEQGIKTEKVTSKSEDDVFMIVERFNNDPTIQCLVLSHKMGSKAINVRASYMIFFSQNFDKDSNMQIEDRIHGIVGKRGIEGKSSTYIRFIIRDSVDERVEEILANNARLISGVVEGKKLGDYL